MEMCAVISNKIFHLNSLFIYILVDNLLLISLFKSGTVKKYYFFLLIMIAASIFVYFNFKSTKVNYTVISIQHLLIFLRVLYIFISEIELKNVINMFLSALLFYELTVIVKFIYLIGVSTYAYSYFFITSTFEILFGLFFSLFKEDNPRIVIKLKQ